MLSFISSVFNAIIYNPLYNGLILLIDILPVADVGLAIILFTIIVKLILFPLSQKAVKTQVKTQALQEELDLLKKKYKDDKQKQAEETLKLYKENNINPFSGVLVLIIQIPIILALYFIFLRGGLPSINLEILYPFIPRPEGITTNFLGLIDVTDKSVIVSFFVAASQYLQVRFSNPIKTNKQKGKNRTFGQDLARSMSFQLKYVLPVIVGFISYSLTVAISLYWITNNIFTIGQEIYIRKKIKETKNGQ